MAETFPTRVQEHEANPPKAKVKEYTRFSLSQRVEHILLLVSFTTLGLTGVPQKYAGTPGGEAFLRLLGGIESARVIHHIAAVALMVVSIYHIIAVLYRLFVLRSQASMLPVLSDFKHLLDDVMYYLGRRRHRAFQGRYTYAEKAEYLAVVWGTVIMAITGFMMWNPVATTRLLSGEWIPAAKAAHGGEAVLAVLAIILWHFYHVHIKTFNKSMFTGKLSEEEMREEHPAELAAIQSGQAQRRPPVKEIRRREQIFFPAALLIAGLMGFGVYRFVNLETTAIDTIPQGETAQVFVPITPTPTPTPLPTPTPQPGEIQVTNWPEALAVFQSRCSACHLQISSGGLSLASYQALLQGGDTGPAIVPGNPEASVLIQVQQKGGHPGQLTPDELQAVIDWVAAGAPE